MACIQWQWPNGFSQCELDTLMIVFVPSILQCNRTNGRFQFMYSLILSIIQLFSLAQCTIINGVDVERLDNDKNHNEKFRPLHCIHTLPIHRKTHTLSIFVCLIIFKLLEKMDDILIIPRQVELYIHSNDDSGRYCMSSFFYSANNDLFS